jgi:hypothetical protein
MANFAFPALAVTSPSRAAIHIYDGTAWSIRRCDRPEGMAFGPNGHLAIAAQSAVVVYDSEWNELGRVAALEGNHEVRWVADGFIVCAASDGALLRVGWLTETQTLFKDDLAYVNGVELINGQPAYITSPAGWSTPMGWRADEPSNNGFIYDLVNDCKIVEGLSWPHSPRWHDGALWFLESGVGLLRKWMLGGTVENVALVPGFARGLTWCESLGVWLIGVSGHKSGGVVDVDPMQSAGVIAMSANGEVMGWLPVDVNEMFDIVVLP